MLENYKQDALDAGLNNVKVIIDYGSPKVKISKEIAKTLKSI